MPSDAGQSVKTSLVTLVEEGDRGRDHVGQEHLLIICVPGIVRYPAV